MATKGRDSALTIKELKNKLGGVSSMVGQETKTIKNKIEDGSVVVIEKVKDITEKTGKAINKGKKYVVGKYQNIKTRINNTQIESETNDQNEEKNQHQDSILDLIETNKELINQVSKLLEENDKILKLMEQVNKNLSKKK